MTLHDLIKIVDKNELNWNRVNDLPCVHTFYGNYYINLCLWSSNGKPTISVDVDDIEKGINDLINLDLSEGQSFEKLFNVYKSVIKSAANIAA